MKENPFFIMLIFSLILVGGIILTWPHYAKSETYPDDEFPNVKVPFVASPGEELLYQLLRI